MKISEINIHGFKRFTSLKISEIPSSAKIIIVIGPNGSGKSSLFDALHRWYRNQTGESYGGRDDIYYAKNQSEKFDYDKAIQIFFHDLIISNTEDKKKVEGKFYFRSAYRNQADFTTNSLNRLADPRKKMSIDNLIQNDATVGDNYQRLVSLTLSKVYDSNNDSKKVIDLREELIGKLRRTLLNVFNDLTLSSIGDPLQNGTFYFEKGSSKNYHYKNLSGGEKAAFDIILDLIIKTEYFKDAIYCIDEPEIHMHTQLQSSLFNEIYDLIPNDSQLWVNTHSLGILKKAKQIESVNPGTIAFLSFDSFDFDLPVEITPTKIDKTLWQKFIQLALDDFSEFLAPKTIILCEGNPIGTKNKNFDSEIYNKIFSSNYPDVLFISLGSASELENDSNVSFQILKDLYKSTLIIRLIDADDRSTEEVDELNSRGIKVLSLRHIEAYLWSDEIIEKLCRKFGKPEKLSELLNVKSQKMALSNDRGNPRDDVKSASADMYVDIKKVLNLTRVGNNQISFLRDTISPLITPDTNIYKLLEKEIFQ